MRNTIQKKSVGDLARFGGEPLFEEKKYVGGPNIGDDYVIIKRLNEILKNRRLTNDGPFVREFERKVANLVGVRHCVAVCNGTVGLEMAAKGLGLSGEVIMPSYTFVATANAMKWLGIQPVFVDIERGSHNIDPNKIEDAITDKTTAVIGVHLWGRACDTERIEEVANRNNLKVIYDAAHALGCSNKAGMIGGSGSCEVFSFHATKFVNSFEGGAITTNDDDLAEELRLIRNFGFTAYDDVSILGINGKMSEIHAAMGVTSLEAMSEIVESNKMKYNQYYVELAGVKGLKVVSYEGSKVSNYQYVVSEIDTDNIALTRDDIVDALHMENIIARRYFWPGCHRMKPYRGKESDQQCVLPVTDEVSERIIVLPTGSTVTVDDVTAICHVIRSIVNNQKDIKSRLLNDER